MAEIEKDRKAKVLVLNPPSPDCVYINRDQMGGMGQKQDFGRDLKSRILSRLKSNMIHLPVVQLVYTATILAEKGFEVMVVDALNENKDLDEILPGIITFTPDFVFVAISSSCLLYERDVVCRAIKEKIPSCTIVTVGDTIPNMPKQLKEPLDIAIHGEIEPVAVDLCQGKALDKIDGILYHTPPDEVKINRRKALLKGYELEEIPFPRWDLFPKEQYCYYPLLSVAPVATVLSSRGCPYGCGYCSYTFNQGRAWRARSAENIVEEIERDVKEFGFKGIVMRDPLFTLKHDRIEKMCSLLQERNLGIHYAFETRPELLTPELLDKLYLSGCRAINFGVEDIHPEILKQIKRLPISREQIKKTIHYAEKIGIRTTCFFILGLPGSTTKTIKETVDFALDLNPSHAEFKIATPYPGTYLYTLAKDKGWLIEENFDKLGGYSSAMQISEELNPKVLEKLSSNAFKRFYYRLSYISREIRRGDMFLKGQIVLKNLMK
jgi:anaerobic magnesium-protoporphyrin IX monomethyl ester cyclase